MQELPVLQSFPSERADAARNREKILCAARRLFAEKGALNVSMDEIAQAAGVGKGTLFRRFGDRGTLALTLLEADERVLQDGMIRGEPPLGPGAPPCERVIALGHALIDLYLEKSDLVRMLHKAANWPETQVYAAYHTHLVHLVRQVDADIDGEYEADVLLGSLRADFLHHLVAARGWDVARVKGSFELLVRKLLS